MMRLIIIESPYKGDVQRNLRYLRACIRDCISRGESPYASHRMLTDALDDNDPDERTIGIEAGLAWRDARQVVWDDPELRTVLKYRPVLPVFYLDLGYSGGMMLARARYMEEDIEYEERRLGGEWAAPETSG